MEYTKHMRGVPTDSRTVKAIKELRDRGLSLAVICDRLSVPKSTVYSYLRSVILKRSHSIRLRQNTRRAIVRSNVDRAGKYRKRRLKKVPHWNQALVECLAHFMFDGSVGRYYAGYTNRSRALIRRQEELVFECFGLTGRQRIQSNGVVQLTYYSADLAEAITSLLQELDKRLLIAPRDWQKAYLRSFFDDEGNIDISRNGKHRRVRGYQQDEYRLGFIQQLLTSFGIASSIERSSWAIVIRGKVPLTRFFEEINFSPGIFMNHHRKNSRYNRLQEKRLLLEQAVKSYRS